MAKGLLGIEVADRAVRYVYLEKKDRTYSILKAGKVTPKEDLTSPETLYGSIKKILDEQQILPARIFVSLSRRDVVIHQAVLPKMPKREIEVVVEGEIEKIPVFFHRPFEYIFQSYALPQERSKTIFAAIPKDILDMFFQEVQRTKMFFQDVEITPLNLKEILPPRIMGKQLEAILVIYDRHTYLAMYDQKEYKFFYKSSMGSESFAASASEFGREHILSGWTAELKRVLKSYLLEEKNARLDRIWMVWDKEAEPALDQRIAHDLSLEVEVLETSKIKNIAPAEESYANPIYALALTPIVCHLNKIKEQFAFDHFFKSLRVQKYLVKITAFVLCFMLLIGGVLGIFINDLSQKTALLTREANSMADETVKLRADSKELFQEYQEYLAVRQRLLDQATYVYHLNRVSWTQVLAVVAKELPDDMALTSFKFSEAGTAQIEGTTLQMEGISELMRRVETSSILQNGRFDYLTEKEFEEQKYFQFGIMARLRDLREKIQ